MDEIFKDHTSYFRPQHYMVLRHLYFWARPMYFRDTFSQTVFRVRIDRENDLGRISAPFSKAARNSPKFPYKYPLGRHFRVWVLFSLKLASRRCNFAVLRLCQIGQTKTALRNPTFIYNHSYLQYSDCQFLSSCLFFDCLQELDLSWFGRLCSPS